MPAHSLRRGWRRPLRDFDVFPGLARIERTPQSICVSDNQQIWVGWTRGQELKVLPFKQTGVGYQFPGRAPIVTRKQAARVPVLERRQIEPGARVDDLADPPRSEPFADPAKRLAAILGLPQPTRLGAI